MASSEEDVYATLLLNDTYLPGALVLAHSLRDAGTSKKLAVLVNTVSADAMAQLQKVYDFIIPVERVTNDNQANLYLMGRPDLHSTFTKIVLWKLQQFRKIVYVDADIVALRAPDELFDLPHAFSAAPDIGWPDIFNTGLMVLTPNIGDYYALLAMAQRGISFDGADQGLLNLHFKNTFNRLSFTYNVTPSAHYQYLPAYRHFQSSISMAHFIGKDKPWFQGRDANRGSNPYDEMVGRWWAVYDRHYRESSLDSSAEAASSIVQYHTKGEFQPIIPIVALPPPSPTAETKDETSKPSGEDLLPVVTEVPKEEVNPYIPPALTSRQAEKQPEVYTSWDASKAPPPIDSKPEASNFPATHYNMSSDPTPWKAPARYPDPPKDMYYEVPKTPTYQKPAPIFPWEKHAPNPTRVFPEDKPEVAEIPSASVAAPTGDKDVPVTPTTPTIILPIADPWQTYTRGNAWDDIPEIERYIGALQKNRKGNIQILQGQGLGISELPSPGARRKSMRLTDFPTEVERPSLPVTPAPIRRPSFWGEERDAEGELPAAEGVPSQAEWDPAVQLEQLARRQSDVLAKRLGEGALGREIPTRPLPFGSEGVVSPTYVPQGPPGEATTEIPSRATVEESVHQGPDVALEKKDNPVLPSDEEMSPLQT